ncbi:MAG TPA: FkbM family methyltransferase [Aquella sp.]|nr:FkbM family methyltransferase [Aquella sp.]
MFINKLYRYIFPNKQTLRVRPWVIAKGDKTFRLEYPELDFNSFVMDLGGYEGQWSSDIYAKYNCTVYIFEPYKPYAERIEARFKKNEKIKIFSVGLGKSDSVETLNILGDESSVFKHGNNNSSEIKIVEAITFLKDHEINEIDLMKINIEGGEYDLLENLINKGIINKIVNIQVQFHDFVPNAYSRMKNIQKELSKTHELTYQYEFVWENWKLKDISQ